MSAVARFWLRLGRRCRLAFRFFGRSHAAQAALLRQSEHRYRTLVEQLPIGIYIDAPDASCTNIYSNPRVIEQKLMAFLPAKERAALESEQAA